MRNNRIRQSKADLVFDAVNIAFMTLVLILMLYPLYFVLIASFSDPYEVARGRVMLLPREPTLSAYANVLKNGQIWTGYANTVVYTVCGVLLSLLLTLTSAYVLSKKHFTCRMFFTWYFIITMYFSGGLIPSYLLARDLDLLNKPYTLIVIGAFSVFNMIITRTFFSTSIPDSLYESAGMDGAGELRKFLSIALPLSGPIVAVMALYYGVSHWNGFFNALIYLSDKKYMPLQIVLRNVLLLNQISLLDMDVSQMTAAEMQDSAKRAYMAQGMKYSLIYIASAPLLVAYPFIQKYFVQGALIGSVKG